jgi:hypothetical protein
MTSITLSQHRVNMDVRFNEPRSGVGMFPWVSECSERNRGITSLISRAAKRATEYCAPSGRANLV